MSAYHPRPYWEPLRAQGMFRRRLRHALWIASPWLTSIAIWVAVLALMVQW